MRIARKRRLYFIIILLVSLSAAMTLALFALRQNIDLYYTPAQVFKQKISPALEFRLGGYVLKGSFKRVPQTMQVHFQVTDFHKTMTVVYQGILPTLFREGQGVVAQGKLNLQGIFVADRILAKHDATYRPPGVTKP